MKTINVTRILIAIMLISASSYTYAQHHPHEKKHTRAHHHKKKHASIIMSIPDLTEKQKEQIKEIHMAKTKKTIPIKNELGEKKARMKTLMSEEKPQEEAIMKLVEEMGALRTQNNKIKIASKLEIHKILTEEQRLWLLAHTPNHHQRTFELH